MYYIYICLLGFYCPTTSKDGIQTHWITDMMVFTNPKAWCFLSLNTLTTWQPIVIVIIITRTVQVK